MNDPRLAEVLHLLAPPPGERLWYGGATVLGCVRGVTPKQAAWKPFSNRHSIWELTLHIAYWRYAVRRRLEGLPVGGFPRSPANWPAAPDAVDARSWNEDRGLLRSEHHALVDAVRRFDPTRLDERAPGGRKWTYADLLFGIVTHDLYHVGQIQLLKRLYRSQVGG